MIKAVWLGVFLLTGCGPQPPDNPLLGRWVNETIYEAASFLRVSPGKMVVIYAPEYAVFKIPPLRDVKLPVHQYRVQGDKITISYQSGDIFHAEMIDNNRMRLTEEVSTVYVRADDG